jgi:hypothetical protein
VRTIARHWGASLSILGKRYQPARVDGVILVRPVGPVNADLVTRDRTRTLGDNIVVRRRANIDFPAPGAGRVSTPARGMASPWSRQGHLEIFPGWMHSGVPPARDAPPDCLAMSQYSLGTRGLIGPPSEGWPAGVELGPPGVAQADTHKTKATKTTRMTCFHHLGMVFQRCYMPVSSDVPDGLAGSQLPSPCEVAPRPG